MSKGRRRPPTIRARLIFLVLACIVPAFLMILALIVVNYQHDREQLARATTKTVQALSAAVDKDLAATQGALSVLATSAHLARGDYARFHRQASDAVPHLGVNNIVLLDTSLRQRVNTLVPFGSALPTESNTPLRRVIETRQPMVTDIFFGPVARKPLIAIAVPVFQGNDMRYILAAGMWPERLSTLLAGQALAPGWIGLILDSTGTIVARTREPERFVGQKGASALLARMNEVASDSLELTTVEGIVAAVVFNRSAVSDWTVAIGVPVSILTAELWQITWWLVAGTALLICGSVACAWYIGGRIAASIRRLVEPALALGRGETVRVPALGLRESDEVGRALVDASRMLVEAQHRANHDELTGLANRTLFGELLAQQLAVCYRETTKFAVAFIDLDGFKRVNDTHGHAAGDELLRAVATRLKRGIRESDVAARLGGDEFAVILVHADLAFASAVCGKLVDHLSVPYPIDLQTVEISASIGVSGYPASGSTVEKLTMRADEALYRAKKAGKRRCVVAGDGPD